MGKKKYTVSGDDTGSVVTISRREFANAVTQAEMRAGYRLYEFVAREELDRIKREATVMDASSWRCQGSCGCPMTNLGVVTISRETESGPPDAASEFASYYDTAINEMIDNKGPVILHIED